MPRGPPQIDLVGAIAIVLVLSVFGAVRLRHPRVRKPTRNMHVGIRMALGAQRTEVVGMVARDGMSIALTGMVIGFAAAAGFTRLMQSLLYDVKPADPATFAVVAAALAIAALAACWGTALKAALVDPIVALRTE